MKNNVLIAIIIGVVMIASAGIIAYGMMNASPKEVKIIENKSIANNSSVAHDDSIKVESVNQEESSSSSKSSSSDYNHWIGSDGHDHYIDSNGQEMVGTPDGQHMSLEKAEYVAKYGME